MTCILNCFAMSENITHSIPRFVSMVKGGSLEDQCMFNTKESFINMSWQF